MELELLTRYPVSGNRACEDFSQGRWRVTNGSLVRDFRIREKYPMFRHDFRAAGTSRPTMPGRTSVVWLPHPSGVTCAYIFKSSPFGRILGTAYAS